MATLTRALSADGSVMAMAMDSTDIAARIEAIHHTSAVMTAAVGRLATAASMMGLLLKGAGDSLTLRLDGGGPAGTIIAVSDSCGNVKAYAQNPVVELPLNSKGKLDVAGAVGRSGYLSVIKDLGLKEPYSGQTPIVSGEIAEDITNYYAVSEQTPTVCALGVLVNPDLTVRAAGGFLVQLLPFAGQEVIDVLERNISGIQPVSAMIDQEMTPEEICRLVLAGLDPQITGSCSPTYRCDCSQERVERAVVSLGRDQLRQLIEEDHGTEVCCHFCGKKYPFSEEELREILQRATH
ncbi:MAG: Hsp33 family molecular chaperone HslO [Candidatus Merdivicinus sp.]|jgi:molecular chaperone Hsp33